MSLITMLVVVAAALALISLFQGVMSMAHGGADDDRDSEKLMFRRVGWQALAFLFIVVALIANLK
jgi:hypothetical protein